MGAMFDEEDENWRESEDNLEFAVLEVAIVVERARRVIFCMRARDGIKGRRECMKQVQMDSTVYFTTSQNRAVT